MVMESMKIELVCFECQCVLSVDSVHAGKTARCPNCQALNSIPEENDGLEVQSEFNSEKIEARNHLKSGNRQQLVDEQFLTNPYQVTGDLPRENFAVPRRSQTQTGLILGIISVSMVYFGGFLCCVFPVIGFVLGVVGLFFSLNSQSEHRTIALILNTVSIVSVLLAVGAVVGLAVWL